MSAIPKIISMDDHLIEPPHLWQSRLPAKYESEGPRIVVAPRGKFELDGANYREVPGDGPEMAAWWHYEDHIFQPEPTTACPGMAPEDVKPIGVTFDDIAPGCHEPKARIADMEMNHVEASLCFPNDPRFCGQLFAERKDKRLSKLCVEAYDDFMVDEWCGDSAGRLIPLCLVLRASAWLGLPSIHTGTWDPFIRACEETGTVICMHIGSGTKTVNPGPGMPSITIMSLISCNSIASMMDWIFSGKLDQFPKLEPLYAESQIGWIPYFLERADDSWKTHQWAQGETRIPNPPSSYYYRHCFGCFFKDSVGIALLDRVGVDDAMFEADYPHQGGTFPRSKAVASELFGHLDAESATKIARGNAIRLLGLGG